VEIAAMLFSLGLTATLWTLLIKSFRLSRKNRVQIQALKDDMILMKNRENARV